MLRKFLEREWRDLRLAEYKEKIIVTENKGNSVGITPAYE